MIRLDLRTKIARAHPDQIRETRKAWHRRARSWRHGSEDRDKQRDKNQDGCSHFARYHGYYLW